MISDRSINLGAATQKAFQYHQAGNLDKAEAMYVSLLQNNPDCSEVLHLLGVLASERNDHTKAFDCIERAIRIDPNNPYYYCSLGNVYVAKRNLAAALGSYQQALKINPALGDAHFNLAQVFQQKEAYDQAVDHYQQALQLNPDYFEACYHLADLLLARGRPTSALPYYQMAIKLKPDHLAAHNDLGRALLQTHEFEAAVTCFQKAVTLEPAFAEGYFNLGIAYKNQEKLAQARACYQKALDLNPQLAQAHHACGDLLFDLGQYDQAAGCYHKTVQIEPTWPEAYYNLGTIAKNQGRLAEAIGYFHKALEIKPDFATAYNNLGVIYKDQDRLDEALACFQKAMALQPDLVEAYFNIGIVAQLRGSYHHGLQWYQRALDLRPDYSPARWLHDLSLPILYESPDDILEHRGRFAHNLAQLVKDTRLDTPADKRRAMEGVGSTTHFYLQYQGLNDLALQKTYGEFVCRVMAANYPQWSQPLPKATSAPARKIRLGYVSSFMRAHTVGVFLMGWLKSHDRCRFDISCFHIGSQTDALTATFQRHSDHFYQIGGHIESAAHQIVADKRDILVFTDIGMNAPATQLAGLRLAPIQCKGWGHPVTTGLPTIDYYLSSDLMEPQNADDHYSEQLVRLPNLALAYDQPNLPAQLKPRSVFGIKKHAFVYLISQSLFKLLPQYDAVYPAIAQKVPRAQFVFIAHSQDELTAKFRRRLARAFAAVRLNIADYCLFLPRMNHPDFLNLNAVCDVLLDTFDWSGGKTTLEAIGCHLPVVTRPGEFMRGRHAYAMLKMLGAAETIAASTENYIEIAARLGLDNAFYADIKRQIQANQDRLFDDQVFIGQLEEFYRSVV